MITAHLGGRVAPKRLRVTLRRHRPGGQRPPGRAGRRAGAGQAPRFLKSQRARADRRAETTFSKEARMPPSQTTEVTPDARYSSVGTAGTRAGRPARSGARADGADARPGVPHVALGLDARPRIALDRPAAGAGGDVRPRDDVPAVVLVLAPGRPAAAPAAPRPRRGRAHRHLRRVRGGASPHGARRPGAAARADPRGVGARRRGPPVGAPDVRGPGRALPLPAGSPPQRQGGQHQSRPRRSWRPSSW